MMPETRSTGRYCCSSRSVASKLPIRAPEADSRPTNSSSRLSTDVGLDRAERRHDDRELAQLVVVEQLPDLLAVLLAEREHQHRGALRPGELARPGRRLRLPAGERRDQVGDFVSMVLVA